MLFYFFLTCQLFYSVACNISCYNAPSDKNTFNYLITSDHFPTELRDASLVSNSLTCSIQVIWQRRTENTQIILIADNKEKPDLGSHQLEAEIGYQTEGSISFWEQVIIYQCHTDQCNSLSQLKHLLSSLIVTDTLFDLAYLLIPVVPFHGEWCYRFSNATFTGCNTSIPNNLCTHCELTGQMNQIGTELCATCSTKDTRESIAYEVTFNLVTQTSFSTWMMLCRRENCNIPAIGDSIREKSYINFDYNKFFHSEAEKLSINKLFLLLIIFLMKLLT